MEGMRLSLRSDKGRGTAALPARAAKPTLAMPTMTDVTARTPPKPGKRKRKMIAGGLILLTQKDRELPGTVCE